MLECREWLIGLHDSNDSVNSSTPGGSFYRRWDIRDARDYTLLGGVFETLGPISNWLRRRIGWGWGIRSQWHFCEEPDLSLVFTLNRSWGGRLSSVQDALHRSIGDIFCTRSSMTLIYVGMNNLRLGIEPTTNGWRLPLPLSVSSQYDRVVLWERAEPNCNRQNWCTLKLPAELDDQILMKMLVLGAAVSWLHQQSRRMRTRTGEVAC